MLKFEEVLSHPNNIGERSLKHQLFFRLPLFCSQNFNLDEILSSFLSYALASQVTFNWSLPIHFLNWCMLEPKLVHNMSPNIQEEMVKAALIQWSLMGFESIDAAGLLVISKYLPDCAWGLWKSREVMAAHRLVKCAPQTRSRILPNHLSAYEDYYIVSYTPGQWPSVGSQPIPL